MSLSSINSLQFSQLDNLTLVNEIIMKSDESIDQDILESIKREYFEIVETFDACELELRKIPKKLNSNDIITHCKSLIQQHYIVSKKVLVLILQKQLKCKKVLSDIVHIQKYLEDTAKICKMCRDILNLTSHEFISSSLFILYQFRKQKILENILSVLYNIKTLHRRKDKLQQFLNEENYPKVISLISECKRAAVTYNKYHCIVSLYRNLSDTLEQVEENLDLSLSKICTNFDINSYSCIQVAYNYLGKSQTAMDQLHMHFTAAVHNTAFNSVLRYSQENKKQYHDICKSVPLSKFIPCLIDLCRSLLVILQSYYHIIKWHNVKFMEVNGDKQMIINYEQQYILDKLESGIIKVFNEIENKITIFIDGFDLIPLKFEDFIQTLTIIDRVSAIGNKICGRNMTKLYVFTKDKFIDYLKFYHVSRLDELRIFLENDGWKLCPIKSTFSITELLEFKTFKYTFNASQGNKNNHENLLKTSELDNDTWIQEFVDGIGTPFNIVTNESTKETFLRNSEDSLLKDLNEYSDDEEIADELKYNIVDDINKGSTLQIKRKPNGPIITNTTLTVLRICGKYLQIARLFEDITEIVIQYMIQIFELYLYAVYSFFAIDFQGSNDFSTICGTNLKRTISRIKDNLIIDNINNPSDEAFTHKIHQPHLSSIIDLNDSSKLYGMLERFVAVESLIFLGQQYESFKFYLDSIVFHEQNRMLNQFYLQTVASTTSLRKPIYMSVIFRYFDMSNMLALMNKVDWEQKDVISQHSEYIDYAVQEITSFKTKLSDIYNHVPLSKDVNESIWECVAYIITHTLIEGFSAAKKCSNGGRALMQLDFTQLISKFEFITSIRPMPHQEYVVSYIKAYYLPEAAMESWIKTHSEYSTKHVIGLISCMYQNKKIKQRLFTFIEDQRIAR